MVFYPTHLYRITAVLHIAAAAPAGLPAAVCGASPQRTGVVLRLGRRHGGLATEEVLLGGARTRCLCGRQPGGPPLQVGAHLPEWRYFSFG